MKLEDLTPGTRVTGVTGETPVTVVAVAWIGGNALRLAFRTDADHAGNSRLAERILYCDHEAKLSIAKQGAAFALTADAAKFKLASL